MVISKLGPGFKDELCIQKLGERDMQDVMIECQVPRSKL